MKRIATGVGLVGFLLAATAAWAETALMFVTPENIKESTFRLKSRAARKDTVEFTIQRDISTIPKPSEAGYLYHPAVDGKTLGKELKVERDGKIWTFRFSLPKNQVQGSIFTLWGAGHPRFGEGVTYEFKLAQFWKPKKD